MTPQEAIAIQTFRKPTPGPWRIDTFLGCLTGADSKVIGGHADLTLCAEAGTVFHETQCTPRQLVERVKELEEALNGLLQEVDLAGLGTSKDFGWPRVTSAARAALSKSLPNTVAGVQ